MKKCDNDSIAGEISEAMALKFGRHVSPSEYNSWNNSLIYMYKLLNDPSIPDNVGVALEYNIPQTSKRIDFIISGFDSDGTPSLVIIELKQWSELESVPDSDSLVKTYLGGGIRSVVHPSYQAWSYAELLKDFNSTVADDNICLRPCAYLHNYERHDSDPLDYPQYSYYLNKAPAFTRGESISLRDFIKKFIKKGDDREIIYSLSNGHIRPSKSLQNCIASMMNNHQEFILIDDQRVVFDEILRLSQDCQSDSKKRTIIVKGGPGTGKSVIAVNLLATLINKSQNVQYVSKNSAPRQVYLQKLKGHMKQSSVDNLFHGSSGYYNLQSNVFHTLLVDEAHRLNEKSGLFSKGENQIKEIINAAYCSVFFIDESQRVTLKDIGSLEEIKKWADCHGSEVTVLELSSQFRCNGSDGYLAWIDNLLEIRETANYSLEDVDYRFEVCNSPEEVRSKILELNKTNNRSRMLAGYCWDWNEKEQCNTDYHDITIGNFEMSWNLRNGQPFAISDTSVNEIGCIHTSQGLEFDYVGVIIGTDLRFEDNRIVTDYTKRAKTDQSLKGIKKLYKENPSEALKKADEIIKNTYRTLMTRGMKGCFVYCTDSGLQEYIKSKIQ